MKNNRIDLGHTTVRQMLSGYYPDNKLGGFDTLVCCEFGHMRYLPEFVLRCIRLGIRPLCGVGFSLETPPECKIDSIIIKCYPKDEEGCRDLELLCAYSGGDVSYEDFLRHSEHLLVGFDITDNEAAMLIIDNILETMRLPDFVLIDAMQALFRSWGYCRDFLNDYNIPICGSFLKSKKLSDSDMAARFNVPFSSGLQYITDNPRKIADRITQNYKFSIGFSEESTSSDSSEMEKQFELSKIKAEISDLPF